MTMLMPIIMMTINDPTQMKLSKYYSPNSRQ
jgi:hypothetical protein